MDCCATRYRLRILDSSVGAVVVTTPQRIMTDMATPPKRRSPSPGKRPARTSSKPPEPSSKPFLRFYHSEALRKKTLSVLSTIEQAPDATPYCDALADVVVELMNSGMDYCFMKPLKRADPGFIVLQSANLGVAAVQQVMGSVIRNIIGLMDGRQLLSVCGSIRQLML
jgi:hypothetical protein